MEVIKIITSFLCGDVLGYKSIIKVLKMNNKIDDYYCKMIRFEILGKRRGF